MIQGSVLDQFNCFYGCGNAAPAARIDFTYLGPPGEIPVGYVGGDSIALPNGIPPPYPFIYRTRPDFWHGGPSPVRIEVFDCGGNVLYRNEVLFPGFPLNVLGNTLLQNRVFLDFDIRVRDINVLVNNCNNGQPNARTFCGFYAIKSPCSTQWCFYNTQASEYTLIEWDFGDGSPRVVATNACHTYANFGDYVVTQRVYRMNTQFVPGCCGGTIPQTMVEEVVECQQTVRVNKYLPNVSFDVAPTQECCPATCNGSVICLNDNSSLRLIPRIEINDQDCCFDTPVLDNNGDYTYTDETETVVVLQRVCNPPNQFCVPVLDVKNYAIADNPDATGRLARRIIANPTNQIPGVNQGNFADLVVVDVPGNEGNADEPLIEWVRFPSKEEYRIGTDDYTFEFWIDPKQGFEEPYRVGGFTGNPLDYPRETQLLDRVVFSLNPRDKNPLLPFTSQFIDTSFIKVVTLANGAVGLIHLYKRITNQGTDLRVGVASSNNGVLIPNQLNHVVITKTSEDSNNWRIYVNGVNQTAPAAPYGSIQQNNLNVGEDTLEFFDGVLAFAAEFGYSDNNTTITDLLPNGQVNPNGTLPAMADITVPINDEVGLQQNYGTYKIRNFRWYRRLLPLAEVVQNFNVGCSADPTNPANIISYIPFNETTGDTVAELVDGNTGRLYNYQNFRKLEAVPNVFFGYAQAWQPGLCCGPYRWTVISPDITVAPRTLISTRDTVVWFNTPGDWRIIVEYCNCCGCCSYELTVRVSPEIYIEREECLTFKLVDTRLFNFNVNVQINLYNTRNELLLRYAQDDYRGDTDYVLVLPGDGIYVVEYRLIDPRTNTLIYIQRFVLYEFCSLLKCYAELNRQINCTDCKNCPEDLTEDERMFQMNKFLSLWFIFWSRTLTYAGNTNGYFLFKECYLKELQDLDLTIQQLNKVCGRCGVKMPDVTTPIKCLPKPKPNCLTCG